MVPNIECGIEPLSLNPNLLSSLRGTQVAGRKIRIVTTNFAVFRCFETYLQLDTKNLQQGDARTAKNGYHGFNILGLVFRVRVQKEIMYCGAGAYQKLKINKQIDLSRQTSTPCWQEASCRIKRVVFYLGML